MTTDSQDNDPPETFHFPPHPDEGAMRRYRNLPDPVELARLAAFLASPAKPTTPTAQVEAALDLSLEAHEAIVRRREVMVRAMDSTTLISLQGKLMAELKGDGKVTTKEYLAHPLVGPVLREYQRRCSQEGRALKKSEVANNKLALERADRRSSPPTRPSLPCSLPEALLYATGAKIKDRPVLDRAFRDFLAVCEAERENEADTRIAREAQAWIGRHEESINALNLPGAVKDPRSEEQLKHHRSEIARRKAELNHIEARLRCAGAFTPDTPVPPELRKAAEATYANHWRGANAVGDETLLAWIATQFHDFWVNLGAVYLTQHEESEARQKAKEAAKALGASAATRNREHRKWTGFVTHFIEWAKAQPANTDLQRLVDTFPEQPRVDRNKGRTLLKTLLKALKHPSVEKELPDLLRREGFNAGPKTPPKINIGEGTIPECLRIVKNHFGGPRSRPEPRPKGPRGAEP